MGFWTAGASGAAPARAISFCDGVLLSLLNPKAWAIIALMLTQFSSHLSQANISVILTLNNLLAFLIRASTGQSLRRMLWNPAMAPHMERAFAACMAVIAVWMMTG